MINIRLGNHHKEAKNVLGLIEEIKKYPNSCNAVWFATEYGYPDLETQKKYADKLIPLAELFRKEGIRVDLQISNTIGHGEYMKAMDCSAKDKYNLERIVDADGTKAEYCFCFRGESFRKYIYETVKLYSCIKPDRVWVDDDLRATHHMPVRHGCFCEGCIAKFNKLNNTDFTREEIVTGMNDGGELRQKYTEFLNQGVAELAGIITDAVVSVSPDSAMGLQYGLFDSYSGGSFKHTFDAFYKHSGKPPASRPGAGAYHDKQPYELLRKQIITSYACANLPDYVEYNVPEVENIPDVFFGKSVYGTALETTLALAYGYTGISYATVMTDYEGADYIGRMLKSYSEHSAYWRRMIEYNKFTHLGGLGIAKSGQCTNSKEPFSYTAIFNKDGTELTKIGLAEHNETEYSNVLVLTKQILNSLSDSQVKRLFRYPVITDATVLESIINRGLMPKDGITVEQVQGDSLNEKFNGTYWEHSFFYGKSLPPYIIKGDIKPISELYNFSELLGTTNAIIEFESAKWAVFGYSLWCDILSSNKRNQIINSIDEISGFTVPAILASPEQVTVVSRVTDDRKTAAVTLVNISIADTEELELIVRNPTGEHFTYQNADFEVEVPYKKKGNDYILSLPRFTRGWDAATVFID